MGREIYDIINDMAEVLNASQMQKLQEVLAKRLSENTVYDYLQTTNMDFLDMILTAKHLEGCSDKIIRYYRCNILSEHPSKCFAVKIISRKSILVVCK